MIEPDTIANLLLIQIIAAKRRKPGNIFNGCCPDKFKIDYAIVVSIIVTRKIRNKANIVHHPDFESLSDSKSSRLSAAATALRLSLKTENFAGVGELGLGRTGLAAAISRVGTAGGEFAAG